MSLRVVNSLPALSVLVGVKQGEELRVVVVVVRLTHIVTAECQARWIELVEEDKRHLCGSL